MQSPEDFFQIKHNNVPPKKGRLLIAEPFMPSDFFSRAVILMFEHNSSGSWGTVLNKKLDLIISDVFPVMGDFEPIPVFLGGPVDNARIFFLHDLGSLIPGSLPILGDLAYGGDFDTIFDYVRSQKDYQKHVKFILGYSGWEKDQLITEIKNNDWTVTEGDASEMIKAEDDEYWKTNVNKLGKEYESWNKIPKAPFLN